MVLLLLPLLLSLGFWQLQREQEKLQILARFQARLAQPPETLDALAAEQDLAWRRVRLKGKFDIERVYLHDNQIRSGRVGFDVIQPFRLLGNHALVWVNRGWLAGKRLRSELPDVETPAGAISLQGYIYVPEGEAFSLEGTAESVQQGWPRIIQRVNVSNLDGGSGHGKVFDHIVRLGDGSPAALQADWPTINVQPAKHRGYAVQWFGMAAALLLFYLLHGSNFRPWRRDRN